MAKGQLEGLCNTGAVITRSAWAAFCSQDVVDGRKIQVTELVLDSECPVVTGLFHCHMPVWGLSGGQIALWLPRRKGNSAEITIQAAPSSCATLCPLPLPISQSQISPRLPRPSSPQSFKLRLAQRHFNILPSAVWHHAASHLGSVFQVAAVLGRHIQYDILTLPFLHVRCPLPPGHRSPQPAPFVTAKNP